jgi:uncharacterized coiled-coil DUF342 family protein
LSDWDPPATIVELVDAFGSACGDTGDRWLTASDETAAMQRAATMRSALLAVVTAIQAERDDLAARLKRCQEGAESLARDLVERNLEIGRLHAAHQRHLDQLEQRLEAVGGRVLGQDWTDGVVDAAGEVHELPESADGAVDEFDAIEKIITQLEAAVRPGAQR